MAKSDAIATAVALTLGGGGGGGGGTPLGTFCGYVTSGSTFPTARPDGTPLERYDYVRPLPGSSFPFTIDGVVFDTKNDTGYYENGEWYQLVEGAKKYADIAKEKASTATIAATNAGNSAMVAGNAATECLSARNYIEAKMWFGTMAQYNALPSINPSTLYIITDRS